MVKRASLAIATGIVQAWKRLQRQQTADDEQRRRALRQKHQAQKRALVTALKERGLNQPQLKHILRSLDLDLIERRERRDLEDALRRERLDAAKADSPQAMVAWERWAPPELTAEELLDRLSQRGGLEILQSPEALALAERIRRRGSKAQKQQLASAVAGIRTGRPKRDDDPETIKKMRRMKTEVQATLVRVRRGWKRGGKQSAPGYAQLVEREVLIPLGWPTDKRQRLLPRISDPEMPPVEVASRVVGAQFHVPASVVRRLGRVTIERPKRQSRGRPARATLRKRSRDVFIA